MDELIVCGLTPGKLESNQTNGVVEAETLWSSKRSLADIQKCSWRKVVKSFAFPDGIKATRMTSFEQTEALLKPFNALRRCEVNSRDPLSGILEPHFYLFSLNKEDSKPKKSEMTEQDVKPSDATAQSNRVSSASRGDTLGSLFANAKDQANLDEDEERVLCSETHKYVLCIRFDALLLQKPKSKSN